MSRGATRRVPWAGLAGCLLGGIARPSPLFLQAQPCSNLVVNGSFEEGPDPGGWFVVLPGASGTLPGWSISQGAIDYVGTLWQATHGTRSVELNGASSAGAISQSFPTVLGVTYLVTFDLAGNPLCGPPVKRLRVSAAGQSAIFVVDASGATFSDMGWGPRTWWFVGTGAPAVLEFRSVTTTTDCGPVVENVRVIALPAGCTLVGPDIAANGSFETGPLSTLVAPSTAMPGWSVDAGQVNPVASPPSGAWPPSDGSRSIELEGGLNPSSPLLTQVLSTVPGQAYLLLLDVAGEPCGNPIKTLSVTVAAEFETFEVNTAGISYSNLGWVTMALPFLATDSSTTLQFSSSVMGGLLGNCGPTLDRVRVLPFLLLPLQDPPGTSAFGSGCPGAGGQTPSIAAGGFSGDVLGAYPGVGNCCFSIRLEEGPASGIAVLVLGLSDSVWQPFNISLPWNLASIGMPGCDLFVSGDFLLPSITTAAGETTRLLPVPDEPALVGATLFAQWWCSGAGLVLIPGVLSGALSIVVQA